MARALFPRADPALLAVEEGLGSLDDVQDVTADVRPIVASVVLQQMIWDDILEMYTKGVAAPEPLRDATRRLLILFPDKQALHTMNEWLMILRRVIGTPGYVEQLAAERRGVGALLDEARWVQYRQSKCKWA